MKITDILLTNYAGTEWVLTDNEYKGLDWLDSSPKPTESELEAQWPEVQAKIARDAQARVDAKASAIAKLQALGLTVQEVEVAFGLTE
jgi:hypothetical protein